MTVTRLDGTKLQIERTDMNREEYKKSLEASGTTQALIDAFMEVWDKGYEEGHDDGFSEAVSEGG